MKFPKMNRHRQATVTVPQLNGGLNLRDNLSAVNDNQLTACTNMWYHKGALRTRPGFSFNKVQFGTHNKNQPISEREWLVYAWGDNQDGATGYFQSAQLSTSNQLQTINSTGYLANLPADGAERTAMGCHSPKDKDVDWYYFLSNGDTLKHEVGSASLAPAEPYVPTIMINGYGYEAEATEDTGSSMYEDFNMLTRAFKCQYTTDGKSKTFILPVDELGATWDGNLSLAAIVELDTYNENTGEIVTHTIKVPNLTGTTGHAYENISIYEFATAQGYSAERCEKEAKLLVEVDMKNRKVKLTTYYTPLVDGVPQNELPGPAIPRVTNNNLTITAWRADSWDEERLAICRMTQCTWFGGERSGLTAGTRLFVCGNPDKPNLVHWSSTNNPLFFPEQNYAYIGDASQMVTGLGKQGNLLFLFKEREIYAMQYVAGDADDYDFAKESGVAIDTYTAKFPVTPIHSHIGCDCPGTIRLVNNRLVWADSTGRVYMLTDTNQYSERNVRELSSNIYPELKKHSPIHLKAAWAGELNGYYLLMADLVTSNSIESRIYLLDTQNSAFTSYTYYTNEEKAQKALPWYVWILPSGRSYTGMVSDRDTLILACGNTDYGVTTLATAYDECEDGTDPIDCSFTTKLFDFGRADTRKAIEQVYLDVADMEGSEISVSYVTEKNTAEDAYTIRSRGDAAEREPGYMRTVRLTPNIHRAQKFGLRLSCQGRMAVENILIKMRQQGVVR